jgi:hypothetical protein
MIYELTKEQEQKLSIYRDKWLKIGLSTERINRQEATDNFNKFHKLVLGYKEKPVYVFMDSPLSVWLAVLYLYNLIYNKDNKQVGSQVWSQVESQVESQVWSHVGSQVESQVESQVGSHVESQVESQVRSQVRNFVYPYIDGHFWSGYFSIYDYCNKELNIKFKNQKLWEMYLECSKLGLVYPFEYFVVISEKPTEIHFNKNKVLHNEKGMSVKYADGFGVYSLNGVMVSKEIVETKAEDLDSNLVLKETNVEVRREIIRKIGVERLIQKLNCKSLDKWSDGIYELLEIPLSNNERRVYLKMRNPSIGIWHIEAVPPEIKTIKEALFFRNSTNEHPTFLT